jgi:leucyl aminopeptidase (aminopeptidase T)
MTDRTIPPAKLSQMAKTVLGTTLGLKRGQTVLIEAWTNSLPYAEIFQAEARKMGLKPLVLYDSEEAYWQGVAGGQAKSIGEPPRAEWDALKAADGYIYFWGPADRGRFDALPEKVQGQLTAYNGRWYELTAKAGLPAVRMTLALATPSEASSLGTDLGAWQAELVAGGAAEPKKMKALGQRLAAKMKRGGTLRITHPNGTDLTLRIPKGRRVTVDDGIIDAADLKQKNNVGNVPAGLVVATVDEGFGEGTIVASRTARFARGRKTVEGLRWTFAGGRLVSRATDGSGKEYEQFFTKGPAGKDRPSLFTIGLNPALSEAPSYEDQALGIVSVYVGGNVFYGGKSKSAFQAYLMLQGADVELNGKPILKAGVPV